MNESRSIDRASRELDSIDWAILKVLQNDATVLNKDLAATVGVAPSTCLQRVRRLRNAGVISAIRAQVDPARIGRPEQAFLAIQLRRIRASWSRISCAACPPCPRPWPCTTSVAWMTT